MPSPLTVRRNNYIVNPKQSDIQTPFWLCVFIASLFPNVRRVFDPCCGDSRLLQPFANRGCEIFSMDIKQGQDFLAFEGKISADLCVCNPPFNLGIGRQLGSEVFLRHILKTCGNISIVLFVPMGFRLNQRKQSKRWRWLRDCSAKITSIMSLPLDCFENVEFHSEVLFFNAPHLQPHYFIDIP